MPVFDWTVVCALAILLNKGTKSKKAAYIGDGCSRCAGERLAYTVDVIGIGVKGAPRYIRTSSIGGGLFLILITIITFDSLTDHINHFEPDSTAFSYTLELDAPISRRSYLSRPQSELRYSPRPSSTPLRNNHSDSTLDDVQARPYTFPVAHLGQCPVRFPHPPFIIPFRPNVPAPIATVVGICL